MSKSNEPAALPSGSITVDKSGKITTSTVSRSFPEQQVREIARTVVDLFITGRQAGFVLSEVTFNYGSLKLVARELRGGAMVFFLRQT